MKPTATITTTKQELEHLVLALDALLNDQRRKRPLTVVEALSYKPLQQLQKRALSRMQARAGMKGNFTFTVPAIEQLALIVCLDPEGSHFLQLIHAKVHQVLQQYRKHIDLTSL